MKKLFSLLIYAPIAIVLIILSVANRHWVVFNLDPINPAQPFLSVSLPFFVFLFAALLAGLLLGGMITWFTQSKHRKFARESKREAQKWQREAGEQKELVKQAQLANMAPGESAKASQNTFPVPHKAA